MSKIVSWYRYLYNGYEPDNIIKLTGELIKWETPYYEVFEKSGNLNFNDGDLSVSIHKREDGKFDWRKDNKKGTVDSFGKAWQKMPAYITQPDYYDESPIICQD